MPAEKKSDEKVSPVHTAQIILDIKRGSTKELITAIKGYSPETLSTLAENHDFKYFCETTPSVKKHFQTLLHNSARLSEELKSVDDIHTLNPIDQFRASVLFTEKKLDEACELNFYDALLTRLTRNQTSLASTPTNGSAAVDQIKADAKNIGNLFWTLGYYSAAVAEMESASYQHRATTTHLTDKDQKDWETLYNRNNLPDYVKTAKRAMEYFYLAQFLAPTDTSQKIISVLQPKGTFDWEMEETHCRTMLANLNFKELPTFCNEAQRRARATLEAHNFVIPEPQQKRSQSF